MIPLELGGNPKDPRNLWPEPYDPSIPDGGARYKDKVENYLHIQVCAGNLTLDQAQQEIVNDWYRVYTTSVRDEGADRRFLKYASACIADADRLRSRV